MGRLHLLAGEEGGEHGGQASDRGLGDRAGAGLGDDAIRNLHVVGHAAGEAARAHVDALPPLPLQLVLQARVLAADLRAEYASLRAGDMGRYGEIWETE